MVVAVRGIFTTQRFRIIFPQHILTKSAVLIFSCLLKVDFILSATLHFLVTFFIFLNEV